jgi:hypothetical protein
MTTVTPGPLKIAFEERSVKCFPTTVSGQRTLDHEHNSKLHNKLE